MIIVLVVSTDGWNTEEKDDTRTCSSGCTETPPDGISKKQNHSEIEKRRRDKMNTYIAELSRLIPICGGSSRKLDKLTVLRMTVEHMKTIRGSELDSYSDGDFKPSCVSDAELKNLVIQAADGFLFVVGCDRGRLLYVSESVTQVLNYSQSELLGQSWFDMIHPKDVAKVKEQLTDLAPRGERLIVDGRTMLPLKGNSIQHHWGSRLCPGARRAFFCRMKFKPAVDIKQETREVNDNGEDGRPQAFTGHSPGNNEKKYSVVYCAGYLKPWPKSEKEDAEGDKMEDDDTRNLSCLIALGRVLPSLRYTSVTSRPFTYSSRHAADGKFFFVDQRATLVLGFLPQEINGSSIYDFSHTEDIPELAHVHQQVLSTNPECILSTPLYRFRTSDASYLVLQSNWQIFRNPFTREIECLIAVNTLIAGDDSNFAELKRVPTPKDTSQLKEPPGFNSCLENVETEHFPPSEGTAELLDLIPNYDLYSYPRRSLNLNPSTGPCFASLTTSRQYTSNQSVLPSSRATFNTYGYDVPYPVDDGDDLGTGLAQSIQPSEAPGGNDAAEMAVLMSLLESDSGTGESAALPWSL